MWTRTILNKMLNNKHYTVKLIFVRYKVDKIQGKTATRVPRDKWIITENAHEPIVNEELFDIVKSKESKSRKRVGLGTTLFSGKVVYACCGRSFYTWSKNHVIFCQTPILTRSNPGCYDKKIRENDLIALIENSIKFVLLLAFSADDTQKKRYPNGYLSGSGDVLLSRAVAIFNDTHFQR